MTSEAGRRWVHVGHSLDPDARTAGAAATRQARGGDDAGLLMCFAAVRYDPRELLDGVRDEAGGTAGSGRSRGGAMGRAPRVGVRVAVGRAGGGVPRRSTYAR